MSDCGHLSDGYHTFDELYEHRNTIFIALCRHVEALNSEAPSWGRVPVWRSRLHSDGTAFEGWFILGLYTQPGSQITYHLPMSKWDDTEFADTLERAPQFDGHTPADVLERLREL